MAFNEFPIPTRTIERYTNEAGSDLTDRLNDFGSSTPGVLNITAPNTPVTGTKTIRGNVLFRFQKDGRLTKGTGGKLIFEGIGFWDFLNLRGRLYGFSPGDIEFAPAAGYKAPEAISAEMFDTTDNSLIKRLLLANAAFPSQAVKIIAYPRQIEASDQIDFAENRHLELMPGRYTNVYTGYIANGGKLPFRFRSNFSVRFQRGARMDTSNSLVEYNSALFQPVSLTAQFENVFFDDLWIEGKTTTNSPGTATIQFANTRHGHIRGSYFFDLPDYVVAGQYSDENAFAEDIDISKNVFIRPMTILLGVTGNARRIRFNENHIWATNPNYAAGSSAKNHTLLDLEPNAGRESVQDVEVCRNTWYIGDLSRLTSTPGSDTDYFSFVTVQGGATRGIDGIKVEDNTFKGNPIGFTGEVSVPYALYCYGAQRVSYKNNTAEGVYGIPAYFSQCRYGEVKDNSFLNCGNGIQSMLIEACSGFLFESNNIVKSVQGYTNPNAKIRETEVSHPCDFSGNLLEPVFDFTFTPRLYQHYVGLKGTINRTDYDILSTDAGLNNNLHQIANTTAPIGTPSAKDFTAATTGIITWTAGDPKFTTGQRLTISNSGGTLPGGLTATTYYYIKISATTGRLATSFSKALSNVSVAISSTGTPTHRATPRYLSRKTALSSDVNIGTESISLPDHAFVDGARCRYDCYGRVPAGLVGGNEQVYYVVQASTNSFKVSLTQGGAALAPTDGGDGTHTWTSIAAAPKPSKSFTSVNVSGDTFNITAHGYVNGDPLQLSSVGTVIGGLTNGAEYFVIADTDSIKLAASEAAAIAGTPAINLSDDGAGFHAVTAVFRTKFSDNVYLNNQAPDGIELEPTGTSQIFEPFSLDAPVAALPAGVSVEISPGMNPLQMLANLQAQITQGMQQSYLLDELSVQPRKAFSIRKLKSAYSGFCLKARAAGSSDSWVDIGFSGVWVDSAALAAVTGYPNLEILFYNQGADGIHEAQVNTEKEPEMAFNIINGRPARRFNIDINSNQNYVGFGNLSSYTAGEQARVMCLMAEGANSQLQVFGTSANTNHFTFGGNIYSDFGSTARVNMGDPDALLDLPIIGNWRLWQEWSADDDRGALIDTAELYNVTTLNSNTVGFNTSCYLFGDRLVYDVMHLIFDQVLSSGDRGKIQTEAKKYFPGTSSTNGLNY